MVEDKDAQRVADALSNVLADTFGLYLKTHSFHRKDVRSRLLGSVAKSVLENATCSVESFVLVEKRTRRPRVKLLPGQNIGEPTSLFSEQTNGGVLVACSSAAPLPLLQNERIVQSGLFARRMLHRPALRRHISRRKPRNGRGPQELMK
jgi:hypothetical protein